MPFALVFDRQPDGSVRAYTAASRETWIDLRFHRGVGGQWLFTEGARLAGLGEQWHTMKLESADGDTLVWADIDNADFLRCRVAVDSTALRMRVLLRGKDHVRFHLPRVGGEAEKQLRAELAAAVDRPESEPKRPADPAADGEGASATDTEGPQATHGDAPPPTAGDVPPAVSAARRRVETEPQSATAQLVLAQALVGALEAAPPERRAMYAIEMYGALQKAVALDPKLPEARYALAQYHLEAPPIAGGSLELAAKQADVLAELGSPLAEIVRAQIDVRRGAPDAARARLARLLHDAPDLELAKRELAKLDPSPR
jgi:hypothetical protein